MMKVNKSQATSIRAALKYWNTNGLIDDKMASSLENDIYVIPFDWKKLAKYSFWVALICIVISISSVLADNALLKLLESIFNASYLVKCISLSILSGLIYWAGYQRRQKKPERVYSNEAILFLGVMTTAMAVYQLGRAFDSGSGHFSILILISFVIYGVLGVCLKSNLIWLFSLISLGSWMGAETGYISGWGAYYLGMNYPLRFVLFGGILISLALTFENHKKFGYFFRSTLAVGLLYLFISTWIMSIFGNYGDIGLWYEVKQIELFHWSLLFGLVSGGAIYHGLKYDNGMTKGFGITFLFINLYTRFFEFFWDATHKAIFFGILAISFWLLGSKAEKIWHLGEKKTVL